MADKIKSIFLIVSAMLVLALSGTMCYSGYTGLQAEEREEYNRKVHGCKLLSAMSRTRADSMMTIKTCTEWHVPQQFQVVVKK